MRIAGVHLLLLLSLASGPSGWADELVQVAPHWTPPHLVAGKPTPPLLGFLARPYGPGRFPAVVVLRWCSGFSGHDTAAATQLKAWGYVALALDSLGDDDRCGSFGGSAAQAMDAYAALAWLSKQPFVAPKRVAVMGFSMGGVAVLQALEHNLFQQLQRRQFQAGVAYYPQCQGSSGIMVAPTLILIGGDDDWASAEACRQMVARDSVTGMTRHAGQGAPIDLVVYPGATHGFDAPEPPRHYLGHFERYDPAAAREAAARVRAFLRRTIGGQPDPP